MGRKEGSSAATTRPRIRDAAARLFAGAGYDGVTMRGIGAAVGLRAGALYRYFPDKESLARDLLTEAVETRDRALEAIPAGAPETALEAYASAYLDWRIGHAEDAALISLLSAALGEQAEAKVLARLAALLEEAEQAGRAKLPDTRAGAAALLAVLDTVAADERLSRERRLRIGWRFAERLAGL